MDTEKQSVQPQQITTSSKQIHTVNILFLIPVFVLGLIIGFSLNIRSGQSSSLNFFPKPTPTMLTTPTPKPTDTPIPTQAPLKTGTLTFPTPNATLCIGQNYPISWIVPADTQNIALEVVPPAGLPHRITNATNSGTANDANSLKGSYIWRAGDNLNGVWLPSGPGYRLAIIVFGSGSASYETFGNYFTLTSCP